MVPRGILVQEEKFLQKRNVSRLEAEENRTSLPFVPMVQNSMR